MKEDNAFFTCAQSSLWNVIPELFCFHPFLNALNAPFWAFILCGGGSLKGDFSAGWAVFCISGQFCIKS